MEDYTPLDFLWWIEIKGGKRSVNSVVLFITVKYYANAAYLAI